jgi:hypothetical protein
LAHHEPSTRNLIAISFVRNSFIIFVDALFTTSLEAPFTNVLDVDAPTRAHPCVWRACISD